MLEYILCFSWAFLIGVFAIPSIIQVAHKKNLLDTPNNRTVHELLTPRLGGLAIFAGFVSALTIFGTLSRSIQEMLAGCILIFFIGLKDDIVTVSAFKKFFVQVLAAGVVIFIGDVRITSLHGFLGINELEQGISYAFTFLVIIGITNSFNLIDGLDGLAGSIVLIVSLSLGVYFHVYAVGDTFLYASVAFCLAGSILGFLRYNVHKAIVFMGDSGSLICGFIISVLVVQLIEMKFVENINTGVLALVVVYVPLFDTLRVFALRIFRGISPFTPDKNHLHHRLIDAGCSQPQTITILCGLNIVVMILGFYFSWININIWVLGLAVLSLLLTILLEVLPKRKNAL